MPSTFSLQHSTTIYNSYPSTFLLQGWGSAFMELLDQAFPGNDNVIINAGRNALPLYGIMQVGGQFVLYYRTLVARCCSLLLPVAPCCFLLLILLHIIHCLVLLLAVASCRSLFLPFLPLAPHQSLFFPFALCHSLFLRCLPVAPRHILLFSDTPCFFHLLPVGPHHSLVLAVAPRLP